VKILALVALTIVGTGAPRPHVEAAPGWVVATPADHPSSIVAVTSPDAALLHPFSPFVGFTALSREGVVVWATTISRAGKTRAFAPMRWPPVLASFRVDHGWEGQPAPRIQQRLRWGAAGGWDVDVRVYFGTQHPDEALIAKAQAELGRLRLAPR
jgi:hypothetical protein